MIQSTPKRKSQSTLNLTNTMKHDQLNQPNSALTKFLELTQQYKISKKENNENIEIK